MIFFQGKIGRTVAFADPAAQGSISLASVIPSIDWTTRRSIITRVTVSQRGNFQFLHTLGNDIYIYTFGDRIGSVTISGLAMASDCDASSDAQHGVEKILAWYSDNRLAQRKSPVLVTIGAQTVIEGFVAGNDCDVVDPSIQLVQYNLSLITLPEKV